MADDPPGDMPPRPSRARVIVWVLAAGVGLWLVGTGVAGIIAKGG